MNETITETKDSIVMKSIKKPMHVRIVSIGAFLMITSVLLVMVDLMINALAGWLALLAGMSIGITNLFVLSIRLIGAVCLIVSILLGLRGVKLYLHRPGRILQKILILLFCILTYFVLGIGIGILLTFGIYLWNPKILVGWSSRMLNLYRRIVVFVVGGWMLAEVLFSAATIGITLFPLILTKTLASFLASAGIAWIAVIPAFLAIPLYLWLPRIIRDIWNLRPKIETFWREFLYHKMGIFGLIIIGTIVSIALLAPFIAPYHWGDGSLALQDLLQPPSPEHILGTNQRGEDIFSRLLYGSQISLLVGFVASVVAVFLGTTVGLIAGYYGGTLDSVLMRITDVFLCLPTLPLMLIFLLIFGQGLQNIIIVIAILGWTSTARMVRSEALSLRERPLTEASHALGASDGYIIIHHIMPNTFPLILANMILGVVDAILSEAGIAFLGFADIHGQPSWGIMLHWAWKNAALLRNSWWWFIPPGLLIMLTTLGFVFISHTADKVVNPRLRGRRG